VANRRPVSMVLNFILFFWGTQANPTLSVTGKQPPTRRPAHPNPTLPSTLAQPSSELAPFAFTGGWPQSGKYASQIFTQIWKT